MFTNQHGDWNLRSLCHLIIASDWDWQCFSAFGPGRWEAWTNSHLSVFALIYLFSELSESIWRSLLKITSFQICMFKLNLGFILLSNKTGKRIIRKKIARWIEWAQPIIIWLIANRAIKLPKNICSHLQIKIFPLHIV